MPCGEVAEHPSHPCGDGVHADRGSRNTADPLPTRTESAAVLPRNCLRHASYATSPPRGSRYTRMSTSLRRLSGAIATRNVIGSLFPITFPTSGKSQQRIPPGNPEDGARVHVQRIHTRALPEEPRDRCRQFGPGRSLRPRGEEREQSNSHQQRHATHLELVPDAQAQDFSFVRTRSAAVLQLIVTLEDRIVGRLVGRDRRS